MRKSLFLLLILFLLIPSVHAHSVTIPTTTHFFVDGTYKNFPKELTFDTVYRINGTWFFDGKTYDEVIKDLAGSPPKYVLNVLVVKDSFPVIATVTVNGELQTTQLFGLTTWQLPYGTYNITASLQGFPSQTVTILLDQNMAKTINFVTPPQTYHIQLLEWIEMVVLALVSITVYIFVFNTRRK